MPAEFDIVAAEDRRLAPRVMRLRVRTAVASPS